MQPAPRVLLAEDNPHDHFFLKDAFASQGLLVAIDCVSDGDQVLTCLREMIREDAVTYGLVVLDAHLPRYTADEVLTQLYPALTDVGAPVVVVSSVLNDQLRQRYLELGAVDVFSKPSDLSEYLEFARRLHALLAHAD